MMMISAQCSDDIKMRKGEAKEGLVAHAPKVHCHPRHHHDQHHDHHHVLLAGRCSSWLLCCQKLGINFKGDIWWHLGGGRGVWKISEGQEILHHHYHHYHLNIHICQNPLDHSLIFLLFLKNLLLSPLSWLLSVTSTIILMMKVTYFLLFLPTIFSAMQKQSWYCNRRIWRSQDDYKDHIGRWC